MNNIQIIHNILNEYFTEENVDLWVTNGCYKFVIRFPHVRVTNEYNKSTDIFNLFAKVELEDTGKISDSTSIPLGILKTDYTPAQFKAGYIHSHVERLTSSLSDLYRFQRPCLGEGPIGNTIYTLKREFNEDLWRLFCVELDKYVATESLSGGPYIRLEHIPKLDIFNTSSRWVPVETKYYLGYRGFLYDFETKKDLIKEFILYVLKSKQLPFNYVNGAYRIALSGYRIAIILSNLFIKWYNSLSDEKKKGIDRSFYLYEKMVVYDNKLYKNNANGRQSSLPNIKELSEKTLITFKGTPYKFKLLGSLDTNKLDEQAFSTILKSYIISCIINIITLMANYGRIKNTAYYGKQEVYSTKIGEKIELFI